MSTSPVPAGTKSLNAAFIQQFATGYYLAAQQKLSRLEQTVMAKGKIVGSSFTINDMGTLEMVDADGSKRFGATVLTIPDVGTRIAIMKDAELFVPIAKEDLPKLLANPAGPYRDNMVAAANRKKDSIIFNALLDPITRKDAAYGDTGLIGTATAAASTAVLPAAQKIAADTGSGKGMLTKAQLIKTKARFRKNECDAEQGETLYIAYNDTMLETILNDTTLTSSDFLAVQMLQEGKISNWLGFQWIPYQAIRASAPAAGITTYTTAAWCKSAAEFGTGMDSTVDVDKRPDLRNLTQLSLMTSYGAGRTNELKVVQLSFQDANNA